MYSAKKRETVHNKKLIHTQNHLNEQVVIELVVYNFYPFEKSILPTQNTAGGY